MSVVLLLVYVASWSISTWLYLRSIRRVRAEYTQLLDFLIEEALER